VSKPRIGYAYGDRAFSSAVPAIYQPQSSKRAVCLFFVADSRHIRLL